MKLLLSAIALLFTLPVSAGVYKCIDASGNKIYRSQPCTDSQSKAELNLKTGSAKDLDAIEKQKKLSEQEQQAQEADKKHQEEEAAKQKADFTQRVNEENEKNLALIKSNPKNYSAYAIPPYQLDALPPLVKRFEKRLPDIQRMRREAAEKVLAGGDCGRVESVELNQKSIEKSLVILVDCSSSKQVYVTEMELSPPPAPAAETAPAPQAAPTPITVTAPVNASPSP